MVGERETIRIQQVRSAVQRHHRLAGSRATLHHQHTFVRRANDDVLFTLNGGDDVAQLSAASLGECCEQRALSAKLRCLQPFVSTNAEVVLAEQLVFNGHQRATIHHEVATTHQLHGVSTGGPIERLSDRSPPVDDQLIAVGVCHGKAPDVERFGVATRIGCAIDSPEHQGGIPDIEVVQHLDELFVEVVAFVALLERAPSLTLCQVANCQGTRAGIDQGRIGAVDVGLFGGKIGMFEHFWGL